MSKIMDAARNLPKDPGHAIATFAERGLAIFPAVHVMKVEDSEFVINFVDKFTRKFSIDSTVKIRSNESRQNYAFIMLQDLNGDSKPRLLSKVISSEVEDIINEFIDERGETFGLEHDPEKLQTFRTRSCVKSKRCGEPPIRSNVIPL